MVTNRAAFLTNSVGMGPSRLWIARPL
jgi:hypothetical protein